MFWALATVSVETRENIKQLEVPLVAPCFQKAALSGNVFILRIVLGISEFSWNSDTN